MSSENKNTSDFLVNKTKISFVLFAVLAALAILARGAAYFYSVTATDIVYMGTAFPMICDYVSRFADVAQMFIGYSLVTYYVILGGIKNAILPFILTAVSSLINYIVVGVFTVLESSAIEILPLALYLLANYLTEFLRLAIISAIALVSSKVVKGENSLDVKRLSPFATPFNVTAFLAAIIVVMGKALIEFFNETLPFIEYFDSYETWTIVITYILIAVTGALGYFIAHFTTTLIARASGAHNDK